MSSWWTITFFAAGESGKVKELEQALPLFFHIVSETDRIGGALLAQVAQNYGGSAAIEDMIEDYPEVVFSGTMVHEQADAGGVYSVFTGAKAESKWLEFSVPGENQPIKAGEIRRDLLKLEAKIARLRKRQDFYMDELRRLHFDTGTANGR
jgi:hypothetical protein